MSNATSQLVPLNVAARWLRVPLRWLRAELLPIELQVDAPAPTSNLESALASLLLARARQRLLETNETPQRETSQRKVRHQ
jgi:hypothetical protein